jgi:DUF4097 and DUF4098 domain-containing protein YvlB
MGGVMGGFSQQIVDDENDRIQRIRIDIGSGLVAITASSGHEGTAVTVDVDSGSEDDVTVEVVDGELIVEGPRNMRRGPEIEVRIATSVVLDARVKTGSGDITSAVPLGAARLSTGSGDVRLTKVERELGINTGSGDVKVEQAGGAVRASTGSGSIDIEEAGDALGLSTGSGDVTIGDASGPTSIKVGSGDITVERIRDHSIATSGSGDVKVEVADAPSVQAETARGDVQVGVPDGLPTYLDLKTVTGRIRCDLQPGAKPAEGERSLMLRARTVSGDITVAKV